MGHLPLAVGLVATLVAIAAGTPSFGLDTRDKAPLASLRSVGDTPYAVSVLVHRRHAGPAAILSERYALSTAHIIGNTPAESLSVRAGTSFNFWFNPLGKTVAVSGVALHPDYVAGDTDKDVAVLTLSSPLPLNSKTIAPIKLVSATSDSLAGSLAVVSGWGRGLTGLLLQKRQAWLVLPRYCSKKEGLCATDYLEGGSLVTVDGFLVGLAASAPAPSSNAVSVVDLSAQSVREFIEAATGNTTPAPPTTSTTTTETPTPSPTGKKCAIHLNGGLPAGQPILLQTTQLAFREPDSKDAVTMAAGESIRMVCTGSKNHFKFDPAVSDVTAECVEDTTFRVNGQSMELHQLGCKSIAYNDVKRTGTCLNGTYTHISIGFQTSDGFVQMIDNCFDEQRLDPVYSRMTMTPAIAGHESGVKRPYFRPAEFFPGVNPNQLYHDQIENMGTRLGDADLAKKYFQTYKQGDYYLARGHLSAKADYIQGAQQRATFYYVNAAPQWQTFNGGNWEKLESSVRDYVVKTGKTLVMVTGIWGTATLPDVNNNPTPLYLSPDKELMRVPKYYWRVVYEPGTRKGVVFVGLNNPYHELSDGDVFCDDVCDQYAWASWSRKDQQLGIGFCCDVSQFSKVVNTVPEDIVTEGLL